MANNNFFDEASVASNIKAQIIQKYFWAWAKIIQPRSRNRKIQYIDLFAGPGRYRVDGTKSTPLLILETAIREPAMREGLIAIFNDVDSENTASLQSEIDALADIDTLHHKPVVMNKEIGADVVRYLQSVNLIPTLCFVDPWGYKGLSLQLINSVLKDWACECVFFFNYNRINMGLNNPFGEEHMNALFGSQRADRLRLLLTPMSPDERELTIVEELSTALRNMGGTYVLPFRFKNADATRTSHHLIFVSKHPLGYAIINHLC